MNKFAIIAGALGYGFSAITMATPITLTGNYVQVGVSDFGTLGSNGPASPGILHDSTGTQTFAPGGIPNDYLTPGTPSEAFGINSTQTGFISNNNYGGGSFSTASPTLLTGAAALGYDNAASWDGALGGFLSINNSYFFNDGDERVFIRTTLTALQDLGALAFGRHLDPDPDVNRFGSYATTNTRGNSLFSADKLVSAAGDQTGLTIGLLSLSSYISNTGISSFCCNIDDPYSVLTGYGATSPTTNFGDYGLQMAWNIGDLNRGQSATIEYAYVMGARQSTVGGTVPEPASLALISIGFLGLGYFRKRKSVG